MRLRRRLEPGLRRARGGLGLLVLLVANGCDGLLGADFDDARPRPDGGDVWQPGGGRCDTSKAFGAPRRLPINDLIADAWHARLTADELSMYFTSDGDVYFASRARRDGEFGAPAPVGSVNTKEGVEMAPSVTGDGLQIFIEVAPLFFEDPSVRVSIVSASRIGPGDAFAPSAPVANVNSADPDAFDVQPYVTPDGGAVYFASTRNKSMGAELFRSPRLADGYGPPEPLTSINSATDDNSPVVTADELTIYFASFRSAGSQGEWDVFVAHRDRREEPFRAAAPLAGVNTAGSEFPTWISPDGCELYLTRRDDLRAMYVSRRDGGSGHTDEGLASRSNGHGAPQ
jgi:hypothetical protein